MKKILITGENSYIGMALVKWLEDYPKKFDVTSISVKGSEWQKKDFSKYDTIIHVAGLAHKKETEDNKFLYDEVNHQLVRHVSDKAESEGVKHFVFLSSMSVYGDVRGKVDETTPLSPNTYYGKSKLKAENYLQNICSDTMKIAIIRPPMVYGSGCKGNYVSLAKLARKTPIFPNITNQRSMIFIDNLCLYIEMIIENVLEGVFYPQNLELVNTSDLVKLIASNNKHQIYFTKLSNPLLRFLLNRQTVISKVFGSLYYDPKMSLLKVEELDTELVKRMKFFTETVLLTEEKI
ncbi:NAD-dependent epimerase/dehydratase family protein [Vagococcus intermedius]|uniref:NAD-dependent epimerase/dehydratase family protein n=1 Tax=Vagococcus intermedius TaxID=2991418 RepID=A0AAF0CW50_9ENTE|nr:NAD-dependent epimerase/dehydratase family protein [Vagococcus intermedius]WEG73792.1 NAD-dependent epimerase/dehydratase family protein [Vagococcus intermedius]WEG75877.1 NAD-dependent epimerase/dehydratase family protein [Vagococcus intermedius]